MERVHAGQRLFGRATGLRVALGADSHTRVSRAVREHTADRPVGPWCDVPGVGLAANCAVPLAAVVLVAKPA